MATKEQERKALEQIKKIVGSLGSDSYIAIAFDGCFQDAEENIENDFALSMKDRYESESNKSKGLMDEANRLRSWASELEEELKKRKESACAEHESLLEERSKRIEFEEKLQSMNDLVQDQDMTIIKLKAKLYDLITEKEGK